MTLPTAAGRTRATADALRRSSHTFTVSVVRLADDGNPPTNLEWYAAVTVQKKDGPVVITGTGATPTEAMKAAFSEARDADVRAAVDEIRAALR